MALQNAFGNLALDATVASTNTKLDAILTELNAKLEAGQQVALDSATLTALETITVANTDFPDAATLAKLEAIRALLAGTLTVGLPSGAATAANQSTGNTSLQNLDTDLGAQADAAASSDTGTFSLIALIKRLLGKIPALGQTTASGSQPVVIASDQSTFPVTVSRLPASFGQSAAASSLPVTLSNENVQDLYITGQAAQTATVNNIIATTSGTTPVDVQQYRSFSVQVVSTGTAGTFIFEGSNDGTNFQAIPVFNQALVVTVPIVTAITASASQIIYNGACNFRYMRLRIATTITGGSIQAFATFTQTPFAATSLIVSQGTAANLNVTPASTPLMTGAIASAAAADATANPTGAGFRMFGHNFNGSTWDRPYNNNNVTIGTTGAQTASFNMATQTNFNARGAYISTIVGTVTGTSPTLAAQFQVSYDAGTTWFNLGPASTNLTATGSILFIVYPTNISQAAGVTPANLTSNATQTVSINAPLPRTWRIAYTIGGTTPSFTFTNTYANYIV